MAMMMMMMMKTILVSAHPLKCPGSLNGAWHARIQEGMKGVVVLRGDLEPFASPDGGRLAVLESSSGTAALEADRRR